MSGQSVVICIRTIIEAYTDSQTTHNLPRITASAACSVYATIAGLLCSSPKYPTDRHSWSHKRFGTLLLVVGDQVYRSRCKKMPHNGDSNTTDRLLVLSCSRSKRDDAGLIPAIARYEGPAFRVARRFLDKHPADAPEVMILSAEYGLIHGNKTLPDYSRRMTEHRSRELEEDVTAIMTDLVRTGRYQHLFVYGGQMYMDVLLRRKSEWDGMLRTVSFAYGSLGSKLSQLHHWLWFEARDVRSPVVRRPGEVIRMRGQEITATREDAVSTALAALSGGDPKARRYHYWYVDVDGHKVSPKWLVSQLADVPVNRFHTDDARRVLANLGIEVRSDG